MNKPARKSESPGTHTPYRVRASHSNRLAVVDGDPKKGGSLTGGRGFVLLPDSTTPRSHVEAPSAPLSSQRKNLAHIHDLLKGGTDDERAESEILFTTHMLNPAHTCA